MSRHCWNSHGDTLLVGSQFTDRFVYILCVTFSVPPSWANLWAFVSPENPQVTRFFTTVSSFYHSCVSMKLSVHVIDLTETPLITNPGKKWSFSDPVVADRRSPSGESFPTVHLSPAWDGCALISELSRWGFPRCIWEDMEQMSQFY